MVRVSHLVLLCIAFYLSVANAQNKPRRIDLQEKLKKEINRCKNTLPNRRYKLVESKLIYGQGLKWTLFKANQPFMLLDALGTEVIQGGADNCWFISQISALLFAKMHNIFIDRCVYSHDDIYAGIVLFDVRTKIPRCVHVELDYPMNIANNQLYGTTDRNQMLTSLLEKSAAQTYGSYGFMTSGFPEEAHYVLTGITDCGIYTGCFNFECKTSEDVKSALAKELRRKAAITATTVLVNKEGYPTKDEFEKEGLPVKHTMALQNMFNVKSSNGSEHTFILMYDQGRTAKFGKAFGPDSSFWEENPELKKQFYPLKAGQFYIGIDDFKRFFYTLTGCNTIEYPGKPLLFQSSFPRSYDDNQRMYGYKFTVESNNVGYMMFSLMENIPRENAQRVTDNYPAVLIILKQNPISLRFELFKTTCFEPAFANVIHGKFLEGTYIALPYSLCPVSRQFYVFEPSYTLKIDMDFNLPVAIDTPLVVPNEYWGYFFDYIAAKYDESFSYCPEEEQDCPRKIYSVYVRFSPYHEFYLVENPTDHPVIVEMEILPDQKYPPVIWRGSKIRDILPAKTSYIANVVWYKDSKYVSPAKKTVRFYRNVDDANENIIFSFQGKKITETLPNLPHPYCTHNLVK